MAETKADLQVELVAADRTVWSGRASMVLARTTEGDVGILADHAPVLSVLVPGVVAITPEEGDHVVAAVDGGFLSVAANRVSILAERTTLSGDVDVSAAQSDLDAATGEDGEDAELRVRHAEALIRAAEWSS
jgi:F-type H+-transporting ATPase subunit epsilon